MRSHEHRAVGDAATGGAMVNAGGDSPEEALWLTFGDIVALSGDFFAPDALFAMAAVPGRGGTRLGTRDELVTALKVVTVDEDVTDRRFDPGGPFGHFAFSPRADRSDVERAVRDRYLSLAAVNDDHFARRSTTASSPPWLETPAPCSSTWSTPQVRPEPAPPWRDSVRGHECRRAGCGLGAGSGRPP